MAREYGPAGGCDSRIASRTWSDGQPPDSGIPHRVSRVMNEALRRELLSLREEDMRVREQLSADGSLFEGYHPHMEAVHRHNAARLREIIGEYGWPGASLVGTDGAEAAWLIVQHAISEPEF